MDRRTQIKIAAEPEIGGSEEEAAEKVKAFFKPRFNEEAYYNSLSEEDLAELDRIHSEDIQG